MRLKFSYALMIVVLAGALWAGTHDTTAASPEQRALSLQQSVKCPVCRGQSVAESDAEASKAIRAEITRRIADGESDAEIRSYLASTLGDDILLRPPSSGWGGLVWVLPVAGLVGAGIFMAITFRRWRRGFEP